MHWQSLFVGIALAGFGIALTSYYFVRVYWLMIASLMLFVIGVIGTGFVEYTQMKGKKKKP